MRLSDQRIKDRLATGKMVCVQKQKFKIFLSLDTYDEVRKQLGKLANGGWEITDDKPYGLDFL